MFSNNKSETKSSLNRPVILATALLTSTCLSTPFTSAQAQELSLERVVLSSGGVGYFEYRANIAGDADLEVDIRLDQVDDVLKSLVVFDGGGSLGLVSMPGKAPLDVAFRDLPFPRTALGNMPALLNSLTGAEIVIAGDRELSGRLVNVTAERGNTGNSTDFVQHRVNLLTASGLQSTVLERSTSLRFVDKELQAQIDRALVAIADNRRQDRRQLDVRLEGQGSRDIRLGYVVAAPLWKTSYRLAVSPDGDDTGEMTGWAILENMSGQDWDDVELVVTSGNPVTFRQALYESYFVNRPSIPVEVLGRILPPVDGGSVAMEADKERLQNLRGPMEQKMSFAAGRSAAPMQESMADAMMMSGNAMAELAPAAPQPIAQAQMQAASSEEAATQVVFKYPEPVSLESGGSVMLPIISRSVPAEQIALYNPGTHPTHPLASIKLTNDGEASLPPGVVTLYDRDSGQAVNFAGDAQLSPLPAGDSRILSFALDQKVSVVKTNDFEERRIGGTIIDGIFNLNVKQLSKTSYTIENNGETDRKMIIEHPKQGGWELQMAKEEGGDDIEETNAFYRLPVTVPAGEDKPFDVILERPIQQRYELTGLDGNMIAAFVASRTLSEEIRAVFAELSEYKQKVEDRRRVRDGLDNRIERQKSDQERVRRLLTSVPSNSDLYRRYLADLNKQEDIVQRLMGERFEADEAVREAEAAMLTYARQIRITG